MRNSFGPIKQIAWLVDDLDASMQRWMENAGVGPWTCYRNVVLTGEYSGAPTTVAIHVGLSYQKGVQIELIEVASHGASPYRNTSGAVRIGMHHVAWLSDDLERDIASSAAKDLNLVFRAGNEATRVAYFEAPGDPEMLLELIEATPPILEGFAIGQSACDIWDGSTAVHTIDFAR